MGLCGCSSFNTLNPPDSGPYNGTTYVDQYILPANTLSPIGLGSGCVNSFPGPPNIFCYGDNSQPICGWLIGYYGGNEYDYGDSTQIGQYAVAVWEDISYTDQSTLYNSIDFNNIYFDYEYLGCFTITNPLATLMIPYGISLTWQNPLYSSGCSTFCEQFFAPYFAVQLGTGAKLVNILAFCRRLINHT